jgi:excisionase family DNA binding protein
MNDVIGRAFLTEEELAERWRCSVSTIRRLRRKHWIAATKIGNQIRYAMRDVVASEVRNRVAAVGEQGQKFPDRNLTPSDQL